jgi:hypothetical protein
MFVVRILDKVPIFIRLHLICHFIEKVPTILASLMMELKKNLLDIGKAVLKLEEIMWKSDYAVVNKG